MADYPSIERGQVPWRPSRSAVLAKTYHRHSVPLIGLVVDQGGEYLFVRRYRGDETLSVWMYVNASQEDVTRLDAAAASSRDEFRAILDEFEDSRQVVYCLAHEDEGVVSARLHEPPATLRDDVEELFRSAKKLPAGVVVGDEMRGIFDVLP